MAEPWEEGGFGLYVHWPFCQAKCPYCDFNSHVAARIDQDRWRDAYVAEIARVGRETGGRVLRSVFFGGGTPSLMRADVVDAVLTAVRATWPLANDLEVTLEANPTSAEAARFAAYRDAGVNRVSIGLQALNDPDLRALGRLHSADEGLAAYAMARETFARVSFDLIYARQHQRLADWEGELGRALALGPDHLSLYQLTIEEGTAFGARFAQGGLKGLPDEDLGADMFALTQEMCAAAGLPAYEVSNHARPGAESRHNLIYWEGGDYAGIGPGAHGRVTRDGTRWGTTTPLEPLVWLRQVETTGSGEAAREAIAPEDRAAEYLLMGLRLADGLPMARVERIVDDRILINIKSLEGDGRLEASNGQLRVAPEFRPVLNAVLREILRD